MNRLDTSLFDLINRSWTSPFLDHLMPLISALDVWKPVLVAGGIAILVIWGKPGRLFIISILIGLVVGDVCVSHALKHVVGRPRPRDAMNGTIIRSLARGNPRLIHAFEPPVVVVCHPNPERVDHGNSFPSSHVVNLFMVATVTFRFRKWAGVVCGFIGVAVAWSRIYCGSHWPSDIPPSMVIGILSGIAAIWLTELPDRRLVARGPSRSITEEKLL